MGTAGFLFQTVPYLGEIISSSINPVSVPGSGDWVNPISWRALKLYVVAEEIRQLIQFCTQIFPDAVIATIWAF